MASQYHLGAANIGVFSLALMALNLVGSKLSGKLQAKIGSVISLLWISSFIVVCLVIFIFVAKLSLITLLLALILIAS